MAIVHPRPIVDHDPFQVIAVIGLVGHHGLEAALVALALEEAVHADVQVAALSRITAVFFLLLDVLLVDLVVFDVQNCWIGYAIG